MMETHLEEEEAKVSETGGNKTRHLEEEEAKVSQTGRNKTRLCLRHVTPSARQRR